MGKLWILVSILAGLPHLINALNCSATPIALKYGNITLGKDPARPKALGVPFILGGQYFAAAVNPSSPGIFVQSIAKTCTGAKNKPEDCPDNGGREIEVGGFFDGIQSKTYVGASYPDLPPAPDDYRALNLTVFDILKLGEDGPTIGNSSFFTHRQDYYNLGNYPSRPAWIGLDNRSVILNNLREADAIASKSWSFFGGWHGITEEFTQEGQLVLGGYDKSKIDGDFVNFPMSDNRQDQSPGGCLLVVQIKGVRLSHSDRNFTLYRDSVGYPACIDPTRSTIGFGGQNSFYKMIQALGQANETIYDERFPPGSITLEDWLQVDRTNSTLARILESMSLMIQIEGIEVTIPATRLTTLNKKSTSLGWELAEDSKNSTWLLADQEFDGYEDYPILGLPFLSSAVLAVNHENYTFSLAHVPKEKTSDKESQFVPIRSQLCMPPPATPRTPGDPDAENPDKTKPDGKNTDTPTEEPNLNKLKKGGIVGIAIGVVAALLIVGAGVFLLYRRRKEQCSLLFQPSPPNTKGYHEKDGQELFEMPGDHAFQGAGKPRRGIFRRIKIFFTNPIS